MINITYADECTDTDGGINYYVKGIVTDGGYTYQDKCGSEVQLHEYYCGEAYDAPPNISHVHIDYHLCPNGCSNGTCIEEETEISKCFNEDTGYFNQKCLDMIKCKENKTEVNKTLLREDKSIFPDLTLPEVCDYEIVYDLLIEEDIDSNLELVKANTLSPIRNNTIVYFFWATSIEKGADTLCIETKKFDYYLSCEKNEVFDHYPTCRDIYDIGDLKISCDLWYKMIDSKDNEEIDIIVFLPKNDITSEDAREDLENKGMSIIKMSEITDSYIFVGTAIKSEIYGLSEIEWIPSEGISYNAEVSISGIDILTSLKNGGIYYIFLIIFIFSIVVLYYKKKKK